MKKLYLMALLMALQACSESAAPPGEQQPASTMTYSGTIAEVIEVDSYTYLRIESDQGSAWIATSLVWVNEGDAISFPSGVLMQDFHSATLGRTFDKIMFVENITVTQPAAGEALPPPSSPEMPKGHPELPAQSAAASDDTAAVEPAEGGMTIAAIYAAYPGIDGTSVSVRGEVIKFSTGIMGANWVTLRDGTGTEPENILVAKTQETVEIGETVTVTGTVKADVSLGYGYDYKVLVEEAQISK
jgi:hypothetical protein